MQSPDPDRTVVVRSYQLYDTLTKHDASDRDAPASYQVGVKGLRDTYAHLQHKHWLPAQLVKLEPCNDKDPTPQFFNIYLPASLAERKGFTYEECPVGSP